MVGAPSFSEPILWIQPTLQSLPRNNSSSSVNFHFPISPLLVHKIIFIIISDTPLLYNSAIFHVPLFACKHPNNLQQKYFPYLKTFCQFRLRQSTRELGSILRNDTVSISPFVLKVWTVIVELTHNHWFFIAQTQKIDILQVW